MRSGNWLKWITACALCALMLACAAQADISVEAEIGYENTVTYLSAIPLRVHLRNDGADADLVVAVNLNRSRYEYDRYEYPVSLAGGAEMNLTLPVTISFRQPSYTVEVLEGDGLIASAEIKPQKTVAPDTLLVGLLSDQPQALRYLNINTANDALMRGETWQTLALSAETFPETVEMMRAFRILAVDGFDISGLSASQRDALIQWLREGGIVIVGGGAAAAANGKGFAPYTGIVAQTPYQARGVDTALLSALENSAFAMTVKDQVSGMTLLSELTGSAHPVAEAEGKTLIDRCPVGSGVVYTCAFSLSERPLSSWSGMSGYWQRLLLACDQGLYHRIVNQLQNYYDRGDGLYVDSWLLRQLPLDNADPVLPVAALIAGLAVLMGVGSYLILKRFDKREGMWITVPILALAGAAAVMAISGGMRLGKPAAVSYAVVRVDENGETDTTIMTGVTAAERASLRVTVTGAESVSPGNGGYDYYIDDDDQTEEIRPRLRYTYTYGENTTLTLPMAAAWEVKLLTMKPAERIACPVKASVWWEQDGLHGEIVNGSDHTLAPGYFLSALGYCTVPEMLPGARHAFAILENPDREVKPDEIEIYEGELLSESSANIYSVMEAAVWPEYHGSGRESSDVERLRLRSLLDACRNSWGEYNIFRYVTFSDQIDQPILAVNGATVERNAFSAVIDVKCAYRAVGESGVVRLTRGMVPAYSCELDGDRKPVFSDGAPLEAYAYFPLQNDPVLCFALGEVGIVDLDRVEITDARFVCESYGVTPRMWIYDAGQEQWEELENTGFPAKLDAAQLRRCLDGEGRLFIRLSGGNTRSGEIYNPSLTLEGRAK